MTKVTNVIEFMLPNYRPFLERMMDRSGLNGDTTVDQVFAYFTPDKITSVDERIALAALGGAASKYGANKFSPKLNMTKHCEILALYRMGYNADLLAKAYNIDRKTVTHMYNPQSNKYKGVKKQEKEMGTDSLIRVYVTDEVRLRVDSFRAHVQEVGNNKSANLKSGVHVVQGQKCEFKHRVEIAWRDDMEVAGWYYKDMDGDFPNDWIRGDDESMKNSQACYNSMLKEIDDPL